MDPIDWLVDSDPALRWQAMRDLTDASASAIAAQRARIPHEGIGARILACQGSDGAWHRQGAPDWLPTLFTMQLLRATGIDPREPEVVSAVARLEAGFAWAEEFRDTPDKTFFDGEVEPCINGGVLAVGAYFGRPAHRLARRLLAEQLADGGWNCEAPKSSRSSFHTTICVLEGLLAYERATGDAPEIAEARRRGAHFLRERELFKRLSTGSVADPSFLRFAFPPRYKYDVLRALDYFRDAEDPPFEASAAAREPFAAAIAIVRSKRRADGRWLLDDAYEESVALPVGERVAEPSRWNTLRALRVLRRHEQRVPA